MLNPCSPPGSPQPSIRSSISPGWSCGTLSRAARTMVAVSSSGRSCVIDPLWARPIGDRAVATITASGIEVSALDEWCSQRSVTRLRALAGTRLLPLADGGSSSASRLTRLEPVDLHDSLIDLVGDTPLVRLSRVAGPGGAQ